MKICIGCSLEFQPKENRVVYCSKSCANRHIPRRKRSKKCKKCDVLIESSRTYCSEECSVSYVRYYREDNTLFQLQINCSYPSARWNVIRSLARRKLIDNGRIKCEHCGWDKFFEACHIKPISSFDKSSKLSEVNSLDNLLSLCPNCHWLFDHS